MMVRYTCTVLQNYRILVRPRLASMAERACQQAARTSVVVHVAGLETTAIVRRCTFISIPYMNCSVSI